MIPLDEARAIVLGGCAPLAPVSLPLSLALGTVTAEASIAEELVPPFANTAVDGFAVRAADLGAVPVGLRIVDTVRAGQAPTVPVGPGEAVRIMTGAPVPAGADAIVMVEVTSVSADGAVVEVLEPVRAGANIRAAGDEARPGDEVLPAGTELTPGHLGVLASLGRQSVRVVPRARVGVFSTGDELVEAGRPLAPGQIRDSNRLTLLALVAESGFTGIDLGLVRDDEDAIAAAIGRGAAECDALITTGGVSMGDFDLVKVVLDRLGDMTWMQVAIRPAKPLAFGTVQREGDHQRAIPVFGLPGNPVSSMVSYELFARPGLRRLGGHARLDRPHVRARADEPLRRRPDGKTHFVRVRCDYVDGGYRVRSAGKQGSHHLAAMAAADALAVLPDGTGVEPGGEVDCLLLR